MLALATSVALTGGTLAHADQLGDTIQDTGAGIVMEAGSPTWKAAGLRLVPTSWGTDNDDGCNIDPGDAPLMLDIITPPGVTADQDPFVFTGCTPKLPDGTYDNKQIKFQASANAVSGNVRVEVISGPAGGGTYANLVLIPITITQPVVTNTKPSVALTGVSSGASYVVGSVPTATCKVTDAQDGSSSSAATLSGALTAGLGSQTATCNYTDKGGLMADTKSVTYTIVAPPNTKPAVALGGVTNGVTYEINDVPAATCAVTDAEDGNRTRAAALSGDLSHGLGSQTATCDYTDGGGLTADTKTATYTIADRVDPTIGSALTPAAPNGNGWYNDDVKVDFSCADQGGSGIDSCTGDTTLAEGENQSAAGKATDWAGNTTTKTVTGVNIDKTPPTVAIKGGPAASSPFSTDPAVAPTCEADDSLSGLASCTITGGGSAVGAHSYTATATDNAGNKSTATLNYTVTRWTTKGYYSPVDMGGTWNTVKGGSSVPLKFEAFAGTTELTSTSTVAFFTQKTVSCPSASATVDEIEIVTTGSTSLRYDTTAGQFIQNWQTPKKPGTCMQAVATLRDGSTISANFFLK